MSPIEPDEPDRTPRPASRRQVLGAMGATAAVAWTAPTILSVTAASAATVLPVGPIVAVSNGSEIFRSDDDGLTWTFVLANQVSNWGSVDHNGTTWVVLGVDPTDVVRSTDDAQNFVPSTDEPDGAGMVAGNHTTTFVAVGFPFSSGEQIYRSTDGGDTWTLATSVPDPDAPMDAVASDGSVFVAIGTNQSTGDPVAWRSIDGGDTWASATSIPSPNPPVFNSMRDIAFGGGAFVAVGDARWLWVSTDGGVTWSEPTGAPPIDPGGDANFVTVTASGSIFVAVTLDGAIWRSTDAGINWTLVDTVGVFAGGVTARGSTFILVGDSYIFRSADSGLTWLPSATGTGGEAFEDVSA